MNQHAALQALSDSWEARGRTSHPSDAMLINLHVRELREAIAQRTEAAPPEDRFEQFIQAEIARSPDALRELGEYLGDVLDEDKFPRANRLLLQLATEYTPQPAQVQQPYPAAPSIHEQAYRIANQFDAHRNGLPEEWHDWAAEIARDLRKLAEVEPPFQSRVAAWMDRCFDRALYTPMTERGDRLLEEVLELLQATGYDRSRVATLVDYTFGRPPGEPAQEVGGVMVTLAGFCSVAGLDMHADGERELARISEPAVMAKIRRKQDAKNALHFDTPLPGTAGAGQGCPA